MDGGPSITTRGTSLVLEVLDQTYIGRSKGPVRLIVTLLCCLRSTECSLTE